MIQDQLNPAQWEAVRYTDGPSLVIAGAGSGKTRVLTYKIAHLLEQGYMPWNILALTFTNKAAREMRERIAALVGDDCARGLWMGTFHSVFARILRIEAAAIGYDSRFTIYDQDDSRSLLKSIIGEMQLDDKAYVAKNVAGIISRAKERLLMPSQFASDVLSMSMCQRDRMPMVPEIYVRYQQRLRQANAMDFDDLLLQTYLLFFNNEDIRQRYAEHFRYVLVDEYQDTNYAQHIIVRLLAQQHGCICVVGDDAQSIYSFRGANIDNILGLERDFPGIRTFKLERNYRSTQTIVMAANSVIEKNKRQYFKNVYSEGEVGEPIQVLGSLTDLEEAEVVVRKIMALRSQYNPKDIALLYRQNFQSRTFEESLRKHRVPYRIYGGLSFYQRKEIKDIIAYCRVAVNPADEEALRRIINYPARGIGNTTVSRLMAEAVANEQSLWQVMCDLPTTIKLGAAARNKISAFVQMMTEFADMSETTDAAELIEQIIHKSGIRDDLWAGRDPDDLSRQANVGELMSAARVFVSERVENGEPTLLSHYLQEVSLLSDLDQDDSDGDDKVTLMTIHSAKGLEFSVVFVVGVEDELFPGDNVTDNLRALEEERRLFYVALTRAGKRCFLSYARQRHKYGQINYNSPSRFLRDIDRRFLQTSDAGTSSPAARMARPMTHTYTSDAPRSFVPLRAASHYPRSASTSASQTAISDYAVGQRVCHSKFGTGVITAVSGSGIDQKLTVSFDGGVGTKQLLARFANLKLKN